MGISNLMDAIIINTTLGEDRRLVIDLPPDMPTGPLEITIRTAEADKLSLSREEARARLLATGKLSTWTHAPAGTIPLSPEEILELGKLPAGARSLDELIDEDRGPR
jgi:hypothetical protein